MKAKTLLGIGVAVVILAVIAAGVWWQLRPQVITFDDGSKLTLLKVEYGKQHIPPKTKSGHRGKSFTTTNDTLVIWVRQQYDTGDWHGFQYYVYDKDDNACVGSSGQNWGYSGRQGDEMMGISLDAFPRRAGKFYVRIQENGNGGQQMSDDKFVISNPTRGTFPVWAAQQLPDTEEDAGFSATLKKLVAGAKMPYMRDSDDEDDPVNKGVRMEFQTTLNETNADNWKPVAVDVSDATGNRVSGWLNAMQPNTSVDGALTFQYGLWPNEAAWKLRVEFSKQSDFNESEQWIVPNIPLVGGREQDFWNNGGRRKTSSPAFAETDLSGLHLKIYPAKQFTNMPPNAQPQGGLSIEVSPPLPEGMRMTIVKLTDDQANDIRYWDYGRNNVNKSTTFHYGLQDVGDATNLNLTLAVHKSHFVEFTAKPEVEAAPDSTNNADQ